MFKSATNKLLAILIVLVLGGIALTCFMIWKKPGGPEFKPGPAVLSKEVAAEIQKYRDEVQKANAQATAADQKASKALDHLASKNDELQAAWKANEKMQADNAASAGEKAKAEKDLAAAQSAATRAQDEAAKATKEAAEAAEDAETVATRNSAAIEKIKNEYETQLAAQAQSFADELAKGEQDQNTPPPPTEGSQDQGIQALGQLIGAILHGFLGGFGVSEEYKSATTAVVSSLLKQEAPTEAQVDRMLNAALSPEDQLRVLDGIQRAMDYAPGFSNEAVSKMQEMLDEKKKEIEARIQKKSKAKNAIAEFLKSYPTKKDFEDESGKPIEDAVAKIRGIRTDIFGAGNNDDMVKLLETWTSLNQDYGQTLINALN